MSQMETFEARLASFDTVLQPGRRNSSTKSVKSISWPHSKPSSDELADAGFYYEPHETNPDNTRCFRCESAIDGWEEEDNPVTEHLRHAPNCGWAIMMDILRRPSHPDEIEDPTSDRMVEARAKTFADLWPHDGKRGWVCQSEKMVAGGWYFAPTDESDDYASCAYCKLSLDGWEPKDDPYDEHYRRAPRCLFFVFAQHPDKKPKASRSKKSRTSKTSSRLSTQSTASEAPADIDDHMDQSLDSEPVAKTKATRKSTKSKAKTTRGKKKAEAEDVVEQMDVDSAEYANPEPPKPKRATRGKKRQSEEVIQNHAEAVEAEKNELSEPAPKRRATRTHNSAIQQDTGRLNDASAVTQEYTENTLQEEAPKRGRPKKKASARGRKLSGTSSTSRTASSSLVPGDAELDAELEAGLENDAPKAEEQAEPTTKQTGKGSKSNKSESSSEEVDTPVEQPQEPGQIAEEVPGNTESETVENELPAQTKPSRNSSRGSKKHEHVESELPSETKSSRGSNQRKSKNSEPVEPVEHFEPDEPVEPELPIQTKESRTSDQRTSKNSESIKSAGTKSNRTSSQRGSKRPEPIDSELPAETNSSRKSNQRKFKQSEPVEPAKPVEPELPVQAKPSRTSSQQKSRKSRSPENPMLDSSPDALAGSKTIPQHHESFVSVEITPRNPADLADAESINTKPIRKSKKSSADKNKTAKRTSEPAETPRPEADEELTNELPGPEFAGPDSQRMQTPIQQLEEQHDDQPTRRRSSNIPPKTVERYSDISREKQPTRSITKAKTSAQSESSGTRNSGRQAGGTISPIPSASRDTPSLSPQSSDAENQPPSTKPAVSEAPAFSPSKRPSRTPLAANTPSPSKQNAIASSLKTSQPWTPIDVENVLFAGYSDKENAGSNGKITGDLTSPEKMMTVEEWIKWNAKNGEERLNQECERLVGQFEKEGTRAMRVLEGIECID